MFNNTYSHFSKILQSSSLSYEVLSIYEKETIERTELKGYEIHDDAWIKRNGLKLNEDAKIEVYRSDSFDRSYYDYDIIINISALSSGISDIYDGSIKIFSRDQVFFDLKYKILSGNDVSYFN